ncbi:MAG: class I SAM-dependent methyltransferase, partial [Fuerstiella sp.]
MSTGEKELLPKSKQPFQIVEGDFVNVPLDDAFDLAHCRYVLIHNRTGRKTLRNQVSSICGHVHSPVLPNEKRTTACLLGVGRIAAYGQRAPAE